MEAISIIICSRIGKLQQGFYSNIKETVGCAHELIVINNSENKYSIFEAYNIGIEKSKYPLLLFIHEDILLHTIHWGEILISLFSNNKKLGLLGIAGSLVKSKTPSAWWDNKLQFRFQSILHSYPGGQVKHEVLGFKENPALQEVVVIDGVFMAMRKDIGVKFNEDLSGFHNYDQSISLDIRSKDYNVMVTNNILIEHFSLGKIDDSWIKSSLLFHDLYEESLPQFVGRPPTPREERYVLRKFIRNCRKTGNMKIAFPFLLKYFKTLF